MVELKKEDIEIIIFGILILLALTFLTTKGIYQKEEKIYRPEIGRDYAICEYENNNRDKFITQYSDINIKLNCTRLNSQRDGDTKFRYFLKCNKI